MKIRSIVKAVAILLVAAFVATTTQSCHSRKKCGCEHDLNGYYKKERHHWW